MLEVSLLIRLCLVRCESLVASREGSNRCNRFAEVCEDALTMTTPRTGEIKNRVNRMNSDTEREECRALRNNKPIFERTMP